MFRDDLQSQALQHTRHRVKRIMECRADGRFADIDALEAHVREMDQIVRPRTIYDQLCREFNHYLAEKDYASILRVYNQKTMLVYTNVAGLCGLTGGKDAYIADVIRILKQGGAPAERIRRAIIRCFGLDDQALRPDMADLSINEND
jgi:hypothetical protein